MDLYDVMRTAFAAREFTDDHVPDDLLQRVLDNARFASSGGNRQGWHVTVIRSAVTKRALFDAGLPAARLGAAQAAAGEVGWNSIIPSTVDPSSAEGMAVPDFLTNAFVSAPVVLVVTVDLRVVASMDKDLPRVGVVSGASIYPFVWNILLALRNEGLGGTLTTYAIAAESEIKQLLGIPDYVAVAAILPIGRPTRQPTRLSRRPVAEFTTLERWDGPQFGAKPSPVGAQRS
jgi:nitroreductase